MPDVRIRADYNRYFQRPRDISRSNYSQEVEKVPFSLLPLDRPGTRPQTNQSRSEAVLLYEAYNLMLAKIRPVGKDTRQIVREAAFSGRPEQLMAFLEPELYVIDTVLVELAKQLRVGCSERGNLLEEIRKDVLESFSVMAMGLNQLQSLHVAEAQTRVELEVRVSTLEGEHARAMQKMAAMVIEANALEERSKHLLEELETAKRKSQVTTTGASKTRSTREIELERQLQELRDAHELQRSQQGLLEAQQRRAEQSNATLQTHILDLQERVRRDAEEIECLSEERARHKLRATWLHTLLLLRRAPRERRDAATQEGDGIDRSDWPLLSKIWQSRLSS